MHSNDKETLFKEALGNYPTGVTIVTVTDDEGTPFGLTVNSFASVSIDPLLILWSIDHKVSSLDAFKHSDRFAVHILAGDQQQLCQRFASKGTDRFGESNWSMSELGLPVLDDAFAVLQCKKYNQVEAGDHTILIGEVADISIAREKEPMLYHRRCFGAIPSQFYGE
ncbi:flavin reductase family protein [Salsuginibacillus kocurii]|uniref:flavin reductase family protein n=1 Tax=Salsuginibacillus kocurii TaxID=427078 RepID=UPI00037F0521|nr:flavin reductase family protein [Salsuginibacillus kocurii]